MSPNDFKNINIEKKKVTKSVSIFCIVFASERKVVNVKMFKFNYLTESKYTKEILSFFPIIVLILL